MLFDLHDLSVENFDEVKRLAEEMARKKKAGAAANKKKQQQEEVRGGDKKKDGISGADKKKDEPKKSKKTLAQKLSRKSLVITAVDTSSVISGLSNDLNPTSQHSTSSSRCCCPNTLNNNSSHHSTRSVSGRRTKRTTTVDNNNKEGNNNSTVIDASSQHTIRSNTLVDNSQHTARSMPKFQQSILVDRSWERMKQWKQQEELGEQIVLRMMEMDSQARINLGITSLRSKRFTELCQILVTIVDTLISFSFLGPEEDDDDEEDCLFRLELQQLGKLCLEQGIQPTLLPNAVSFAMTQLPQQQQPKDLLQQQEEEDAWKTVLTFMVAKMQPTENPITTSIE